MSQEKGTWGSLDEAFVQEVAQLSQMNLVRALRDPRQVASLRKDRGLAWMKDHRYAVPIFDLGSEEDLDTARDTVLKLGGYLGGLTGQEENDVYALSIWLADALLLFASRVEPLVWQQGYLVSISGWLLEGRIALWALISDLDALVAQCASILPAYLSPRMPGQVRQARLWDETLQGQEVQAR